MKSMKNMKKGMKDMGGAEVSMPEYKEPEYPYGLKISLQNESLKKLGIKEMPEVGQKMMVHAMCEVCSVSKYDSKEGGEVKSMELQITDMELMKNKKSDSEGLYS